MRLHDIAHDEQTEPGAGRGFVQPAAPVQRGIALFSGDAEAVVFDGDDQIAISRVAESFTVLSANLCALETRLLTIASTSRRGR
jgi:hypothetical protein